MQSDITFSQVGMTLRSALFSGKGIGNQRFKSSLISVFPKIDLSHWVVHLNITQMENFRLSFSSGSCNPCLVFQVEVVLRVYPLHPLPSSFLYSLFLSLCCFCFLVNGHIQVSFRLKPILCVKITQILLLISFKFVYTRKIISF